MSITAERVHADRHGWRNHRCLFRLCQHALARHRFTGVPEPFVKRTVEGDLGMRVSAMVVGESAKELVNVNFAQQPAQLDAFYHYSVI